MVRYLTAGESHGPALTAIVEGMPGGLEISDELINKELSRRQQGYGRGERMKIERDRVEFLAGVRFGQTLGSPVTLQIINKDWVNWQERMAPFGSPAGHPVTQPRPGHADLTGHLAYRRSDVRDILERASARETAVRVAVGALAKQLLKAFNIVITGHVVNIGGVVAELRPQNSQWTDILARSQVACLDVAAEAAMLKAIDKAKSEGDTLGGIFEIVAFGVPPGLGSHVHWDRKLDGLLGQALMSIQAVKGVEVGLGFAYAGRGGSAAHDEIFHAPHQGYYRNTNYAGGIEGGYSNGEPLVMRAVMKPIPTLMRPLRTVDIVHKTQVLASTERSDVCAVPAAAVVGEAVVAITLAGAMLERFGRYSLAEMLDNYQRCMSNMRGE